MSSCCAATSLFDVGLIAFNPKTETLDVAAEFATYPDYTQFLGKVLTTPPPPTTSTGLPNTGGVESVQHGAGVGHRGFGADGSDDQMVGDLAGVDIGLVPQAAHRIYDTANFGEKILAGRGELHCAAGAIDELHADSVFQRADLLAERRLCHEHAGCRAAEVQFLGQYQEQA